jgi:hypothetical protein
VTNMAAALISAGMDEVRQHRLSFFIWGILLIILGFVAIGSSVVTTLISVMLLGWILIFSGIFAVIHGLTRRRWHGFFLNLLAGLLNAVVGFLMVSNPALAAAHPHATHRDAPRSRGNLSRRHRLLITLRTSRMAHFQRHDRDTARPLDLEFMAHLGTLGDRTFYRY